jgi:hypothetical protein
VDQPRQIRRPPRELPKPSHEFGTAAIGSALCRRCGILRAFLVGPVAFTPGLKAVGDDDGVVVVVPPKVAPEVIAYCRARETREVFERMKLEQTGDIARYYPFNQEGKREYEDWLRATGRSEEGR